MAALSSRRPRTVVWELTAGCSLHCAHCYNVWTAAGAPSIRDVSTSEAVAIAHRLPPWLESVVISGGEPLLRSDVETIVVAIRETIQSVSIATNGLILTDRRAQSLALAGVTSVQITLLASEPKLHDALVGRDGAFDAVLRAIAAARRAGLTVVVFFVLLRANANMLPGVSKLAHAMGAAGVVLNRFQPGGRALQQTSSLTPTPNQIQNALASAKALRPITEVVLGTIVPPCEGGPLLATITRCPLGTSKAYPTIGPSLICKGMGNWSS